MTEHCSKKVHSPGSWGGYPCARKATIERDGKWWCWQHDPEAVEARHAERLVKQNAEWAAKKERWARQKIEADRADACVAFFHGRDIPTERIAEGGFWEMVDILNSLCEHGMVAAPGPHFRWTDEYYELFNDARALLTKLGVKP